MRISNVVIKHYRCIELLDLEVEDYTVLIGPNGAGKSTVLYALDWFFNGGQIGLDDVHGGAAPIGNQSGDADSDEDDREVSVEVTFSDLTAADREVLGRYGRGDVALFRRTWVAATGEVKIVGNARQGPGFAAVRNAGSAPETKKEYARLQADRPDLNLPDDTAKQRILGHLDAWEAEPANADALEPVQNSDATHMFGIQGEHLLEQRVRYILIPASADIASEVGENARGSTLSRLIGGLVVAAVNEARDAWTTSNQPVLDQLTTAIASGVSNATGSHTLRVNERLASLLPSAEVAITPTVTDWAPKIDPKLSTSVTLDGRTHDVSRQGHGVQRAVMIAMLQALVPSAPSSLLGSTDGGADSNDASRTSTPTFIVAIEEPEIYQHPVRARHLARALFQLSETAHHQVLLATHSPYFVRPDQFTGLRRISMASGRSRSTQTTESDVAAAAGVQPEAVRNRLEKELPRTFSEGFFADVAVLVEGDTDKVLFETISERLGQPLDAAGVAVLSVGGKGSMRLAVELLEQLGTPTFVVVDGDFLGHQHGKHVAGSPKAQAAHASHQRDTEEVLQWLEKRRTSTVHGPDPATFGSDTSVADCFCVLHDDIEHELQGWTGYQAALTAQGIATRGKNAGAYRAAASSADPIDVPAVFAPILAAMINRKQN